MTYMYYMMTIFIFEDFIGIPALLSISLPSFKHHSVPLCGNAGLGLEAMKATNHSLIPLNLGDLMNISSFQIDQLRYFVAVIES